MRVVLDTNILLSAFWTPNGLEAQLVGLAISGRVTGYVSEPVLAEYRDVLFRPKFASKRDSAEATLNSYERAATLVQPEEPLNISPDEDDNRFLECAVAARADFLVSGNLKDFPEFCGETRIVNARQFFEINSTL